MARYSDPLTPPDFSMPLAATRIYDRSPEWKFHTRPGLAKAAFARGGFYRTEGEISQYSGRPIGTPYVRPGELWLYENGEWKLEFFCDDGKNAVRVRDLPWRNDG